MNKRFLLTLLFVPLVSHSQTLCNNLENIVLSCQIGKKNLSLCSSTELDDSKGWLQYRYGTAEKVELEFPKENSHPKSHFKFNRIYSAAEGALIGELRFKNGKTDYTVYREDIKGKVEAGVYVTINSKDTYLKCKNLSNTEDFISIVMELGLEEFN